ncbi:MAG: tRNA uridine-5-carboxymethylaminomethyl(34) synthesis GTPase MnmE [Deltaproteobacteria bacterium]|jgi:tRNA modification GTPase|nr:tRNA uridine-5-carboxymethylaminomethyl(34) synthesis GTPase MnmE [Deltaproteobacteria bacterium]
MSNGGELIAAISTATGPGAVAVIRLSGAGVLEALEKCFQSEYVLQEKPRELLFGKIIHPSSRRLLDHVLAVFFPGPNSFTGEDSAEIQGHGGSVLPRLVLEAVLASGARLARPGEFTERAFLNGKLSLDQAEAVAEIVAAESEAEAAIAAKTLDGALRDKIFPLANRFLKVLANLTVVLDFEEEWEPADYLNLANSLDSLEKDLQELLDFRQNGRIYRDGLKAVLAGPPNAGKSSLFNALIGKKRALVSQIPGTTRDYLTTSLTWESIRINLVDTAGLREEGADELEAMGRDLALEQIEDADLVLWVQDLTAPPLSPPVLNNPQTFLLEVWNKADLRDNLPASDFSLTANPKKPASSSMSQDNTRDILKPLWVSALTGFGLADLKQTILQMLGVKDRAIPEIVPNLRQELALKGSLRKLGEAKEALAGGEYPEIVGILIREAADSLGLITGRILTEDLLTEVFSHFCLGK